jgi:ketosteroid isomerase-like protein
MRFLRMKDFRMEGHRDIQEIEILGKHAYIRNHLEITLTKAGDAPKRMSGYTMGILRKESDGRWRLLATRIQLYQQTAHPDLSPSTGEGKTQIRKVI